MHAHNQEIAKIFYEMAEYLAMKDIPFKPQAYEKAAMNLESLERDVSEIYENEGIEGLMKLPGIGKSMAEKIEEFLKTGRVKEYEKLKKEIPVNISELTAVEGLGPKMVKELYKHLKIKNLEELEKAAKEGKIRNLPGFGEKTEKNILEGIEFLKRSRGRFLLGEILPYVEEIVSALKNLKEVKKISPAGSARRMKETIGDVDILIVTDNPEKIMDYFVSLPHIEKIWGRGKTKSSVRMEQGFDVDLRVVDEESFGSALQYFTGSKEHNIALRQIAIKKGYKLNEYGLFKGKKKVAGRDEKEIYEKLGLDWIPPEMREDRGEIELAEAGKLPKLVEQKDIRGDLHCHSNWNGGHNSIEEIAEAGMKMGYEYIGIADHTKFLKIEHGLDEKQLRQRNKEIDDINLKFKIKNLEFRILKGCEANIMPDGSIDIDDEVLAEMDFVIAGVHSQFKMTKEQMTERIIKAMKNPNVDIISHPTGRILMRRDEYEIDFDKILEVAKETGTILEINAFPDRLDLNDINIKKAKEMGVKMIINTDSHHIDQLRFMQFGVAQARRGWAEKEDIINTYPLHQLISFLKK